MSEIVEREEYTCDTYPCSGKKYNGEKAIISLTSWKKRIKSCPKTIFSLLQMCPGFHIVLVLSEEEFPQKEKELPENLMVFIENGLIELLWVWKNYKSFKKVLFTMSKYKTVPIISADDGQIYTENFAEKLYRKWYNYPSCICSKTHFKYCNSDFGVGCRGIIYPPNCFGDLNYKILLPDFIIKTNHDDAYIGCLAKKLNIKWVFLDELNIRKNNFLVLADAERYGLTKNKKFKNSAIFLFRRFLNTIY